MSVDETQMVSVSAPLAEVVEQALAEVSPAEPIATNGHGEKFERLKEVAIAALLTQPTIEKAAEVAGVSDKTLWRWLQMPEFAEAYQLARAQVLEQTLSVLHKATTGAVATLVRNLRCGNPSVEVRAAIGILDQTFKARELLETEARLRVVEQMIEHSNKDSRRNGRRSANGDGGRM